MEEGELEFTSLAAEDDEDLDERSGRPKKAVWRTLASRYAFGLNSTLGRSTAPYCGSAILFAGTGLVLFVERSVLRGSEFYHVVVCWYIRLLK